MFAVYCSILHSYHLMCTKSISTVRDGGFVPCELVNGMCSGVQAIMHALVMANDSSKYGEGTALELHSLLQQAFGVTRSTPAHNGVLLKCNVDQLV